MTCGGCSGAVERVLKKLDGTTPPLPAAPQGYTAYSMLNANLYLLKGLQSYDVNLESQTAIVNTEAVPFETVLATIQKTGKAVTAAEVDGEARNV